MTMSQTFKTTATPEQMETLEEWLRNYNGAANTPADEMTLQQAFEECVGRGILSMAEQNAAEDKARLAPLLRMPKEVK